MVSNKTSCLVVVLVFIIASKGLIGDVSGAGECGKTPIRSAATSLSPCLSAAGNAKAKVPPTCCTKVSALIKTAPKCLCAVLLSPLAKKAGINPATAITIPKRCSIRNRPVGKKCGIILTDESSEFLFPNVLPGKYRLEAIPSRKNKSRESNQLRRRIQVR